MTFNHGQLHRHGLTLNKIKYFGISGNPRILHCKIGPDGLVVIRGKNCVLVGLYRPPIMPPQVRAAAWVCSRTHSKNSVDGLKIFIHLYIHVHKTIYKKA
jgi:hypothetical protein